MYENLKLSPDDICHWRAKKFFRYDLVFDWMPLSHSKLFITQFRILMDISVLRLVTLYFTSLHFGWKAENCFWWRRSLTYKKLFRRDLYILRLNTFIEFKTTHYSTSCCKRYLCSQTSFFFSLLLWILVEKLKIASDDVDY